MREVANYCIIDALCYQELLVKLSVINDYREVAFIAYVSLFDTYYRANGIKVRNLLDAYAVKQDILFNTRVCENIEKGKYPDAYVFLPKKDIETKRPVTVQRMPTLREKMKIPYMRLAFHSISVTSMLASLGKKKEQLGKVISSTKERGKRISESLNLEYSSICFDHDYQDLKQRALKVYMNTFYRKAGNSKSPIFLHELAGETTSAGKFSLNLIAEFMIKKEFGIKYGDTNSLYLICSDKYYEKCDEVFSRNELFKEAYWTEMVKITMDVMKKLRDQINAYLKIKSETSYLKMVYEEVLFPVCFIGKKKYFGIEYEDVKIMREAIDINNTRSIHEIVEDTLREVQNKEWDYNEFIVMRT
ncbi:DNA polymerase family B-domain-containing protein [Glomus cerebriforme]|uniref:DNA polymerase family B-domain-containing protein n=1 Tax=Glomus cerebriforme TaxID=658196 RepID=A0A397TLT2_9GLOM|nr:DNA polymerase family B-domain-containing protein [Glomus cerebriforme]